MYRFYDNTRLSCHKTCNRKYLYRHVKNWQSSGFAPELVFGLAWHSSMDVIWRTIASRGNTPSDLYEMACAEFMKKWVEEGGPSPEEMGPEVIERLGFRNFHTAFEMIDAYIQKRSDYIASGELLAVEQPFVVPLTVDDETLFYCGRLDKVFKNRNREVEIIEHKTTSAYQKMGSFRNTYLDSFSPNGQVDGYQYGAKLLYPNYSRLMVDIALVHKTIHDAFKFLPVVRNNNQLDEWRWETLEEIRRLEDNKEAYQEFTEWKRREDPGNQADWGYLPAFPKNTEVCFLYNRPCAYLEMCKYGGNPAQETIPPGGFDISHWSPFDHVDLEALGYKREEAKDE